MSAEGGINITGTPEEYRVTIAQKNLNDVLELFSIISIQENGEIILSTIGGTRVALKTILIKIFNINGVEIVPIIIQNDPIKIKFSAVIGFLEDHRNTDE